MAADPLPLINIHEAKTHLSRIVDEVKTQGKPVIIARAGKPQVKIVPLEQPSAPNRFGFMKAHRVAIPDNFDRLHEDEIIALFEGRPE